MATRLRFRPVMFGRDPRVATYWYLGEQALGKAYLRDFEVAWPLAVGLEVVTPADFPPAYRLRSGEVTILPIEEVEAETAAEALTRFLNRLARLEAGDSRLTGAPQSS